MQFNAWLHYSNDSYMYKGPINTTKSNESCGIKVYDSPALRISYSQDLLQIRSIPESSTWVKKIDIL